MSKEQSTPWERRLLAAERSLTHGNGLDLLTDREFDFWLDRLHGGSDGTFNQEEYCLSLCFYAAMARLK